MTLFQFFGWLVLIAVVATGALMLIGKRREPEEETDMPRVIDPVRKARFEVRKYDHDDPTDKGRFFAMLFAGNGQEIARSERYVNVAGARKWPDRIRRWAQIAPETEDIENLVSQDDAASGRR